MTKAFDFVNHKILLDKLERYGIRGKAQEWIQSYLNGRKICTQISKIENNIKEVYKSQYKCNKRGVPQGSILGPFLFLTYINDLTSATTQPCVLFADDTTILIKCKSIETYEQDINEALKNIVDWLTDNDLQVNLNKTKLMQFSYNNVKTLPKSIIYNDSKVDEVETLKFLGIMYDHHCNWKSHIDYICSRLDRFVYALRRLVQTISVNAALSAYHGYVSSVLSYGIVLWGNSVDFIKAFRLQKKCIRAICNVGPLESCKPLFKKLGILPLPCMYIKNICIFVKQYPKYFKRNSEINSKRPVRYPNKLIISKCCSSTYMKSAYCMAVKLFNKLPKEFEPYTLNMFKRKINKWLLEKCYYDINEYLE